MSTPLPDRCPLCGQSLGEPSVRLSAGGRAHRGCAERQAAAAWRWRSTLALGHLTLIALALLTLTAWAGPSPALLIVASLWAGLHTQLHARFWHYTVRDLRRLLRRHHP